jgi:predicted PurR-regulated permease PerM
MVVGLTITGLVLVLLFYFRNLIGPLLLAFILTYLLHPLAVRLNNTTRLNWRTAVSIIYFILIILVAGLITLTGLAVIQQIQNVIQIVQDFIYNLPTLFADLTTRAYTLGPFTFDLSQFDLKTLSDQLLGSVQPLLGRLGSLVSTFATSALTSFAWGLFILVISYFLLADGGRVPDTLNFMHIPGYDADIKRIGHELGRTWNAFLRGQLIIMVLIILLYMVLLNILGVRYAIAIAILAGLAKFVPYVGPFMTWLVTAMVIIFTNTSHFGIRPVYYAGLVIVIGIVVDQIFDNLVTPRLLGQTLGVHPAAVLVAAIIAASLIGIIGLLLAAPVLATVNLLGRYIIRKMLDQDPWPEAETGYQSIQIPLVGRAFQRLRVWWRSRRQRSGS